MKIQAVAGMVLVLFFTSTAGAVDAPHALGGFVLGETIDRYTDRLKMDTMVKLRDTGCLMEADVIPPEGFANGSVTYGVCVARNRIVRIKLKYEDDSAPFYEKLLLRYKQRFGEPDEWKGDPFHVVVAWKWYFKDRDNNKISLILQHNSQDEDEKIGNSVKMTLSSQMVAEIQHYRESHSKGKPLGRQGRKAPDWDQLVPR